MRVPSSCSCSCNGLWDLIIYFYFLKSEKGIMKYKNKNWEVSVKQEYQGT
jgi:hypothetical protein